MKKLAIFVVSAMLVLGMTACGANEKGSNGNNSSTNTEQSPGTNNGLKETIPTAEELIEKSTVASAELKSFSMDMKMKQNITMTQGDQTEEQLVDMAMKSDFIKEPLKMVQEIEIVMPEGKQLMTQYVTKEGVYTQVDGTWIKQPDTIVEQMTTSLEESVKPEKQLEYFKTIAKDTKITVENDNYIMTAELSGDGVKELAKSLLSQGGASNDQMSALLDTMNIKAIKIVSGMNKETLLPTKSDVTMSAEMEQEGIKISFDIDLTSTYSKYNEVGEINIPQEALDAQIIE